MAEIYIKGDEIDVQKLYRAVADREPAMEIMQMIHDLFGSSCDLRPPSAELRLAERCNVRGVARG